MNSRVKSIGKLQKDVFRSQAILVVALAFFLTFAGFLVNWRLESSKRDQNLLNVAEMVASLPTLSETGEEASERARVALDSLHKALVGIDVISVVDSDGIRRYHTNHALVGSRYDGTSPDFSNSRRSYAFNSSGPSGPQRRAFAEIVGVDGRPSGFVIVVMLRKNIRRDITTALAIFLLIAAVALLVELPVSYRLSMRIKRRLMGFEPESFLEMYKVRDGILESLEEGVVAVDAQGAARYMNRSAATMLGVDANADLTALGKRLLGKTLERGEHETNVPEEGASGASILMDRVPIRQGNAVAGAVAVLHDRTERARLAEELSGARFLVDSMRANTHDFTNKLHVILGLLQMREYDQAAAYIENVEFVQREGISRIMKAADDPALAALLVGKTAKATECNVRFSLEEGSCFRRSDVTIPTPALVTIVGNLIDNALEAMNDYDAPDGNKELLFGIYSAPNSLTITVDDSGPGIAPENLERVFERGFTTKGGGRGAGLYEVKRLVESLGGEISVKSAAGEGASFTVVFKGKGDAHV